MEARDVNGLASANVIKEDNPLRGVSGVTRMGSIERVREPDFVVLVDV
jgi:hypothetical protein